MNIIYARMPGYDWVSTPSDAVARELERLGHKLTLVENMEYIPPGDYDFVWSPYESVTILGHLISKKLSIPHVAHIETIPPWRYFLDCDIENYGIPSKDQLDVPNIELSREHYKKVGEFWAQSHIKTVSNKARLTMHEKEFQVNNVGLRYPSVDVRTITEAKKMYSPERQPTIVSLARATHIKRYDLLVDVMNHINKPVVWNIIGDGVYTDEIKKSLTNKNVTVNYMGALWGWSRFYELMRSSVLLYAMGAMPPIEAALLGCFPICIEQQPTKHLPEFDRFMYYNFGESLPIFKHTEAEKAARLLEESLPIPDQKLKEWSTVDKFMSGETNVTSSEVNASQIIKGWENAC